MTIRLHETLRALRQQGQKTGGKGGGPSGTFHAHKALHRDLRLADVAGGLDGLALQQQPQQEGLGGQRGHFSAVQGTDGVVLIQDLNGRSLKGHRTRTVLSQNHGIIRHISVAGLIQLVPVVNSVFYFNGPQMVGSHNGIRLLLGTACQQRDRKNRHKGQTHYFFQMDRFFLYTLTAVLRRFFILYSSSVAIRVLATTSPPSGKQ